MIGNPPWDVMKPNSQEFFTDFDPLYRTYDKQAALRKQSELFAAMPGVWRAVGRVQRPLQGPGQLGQERRRSVRPGPGTRQGGQAPGESAWAQAPSASGSASPTPEHPFRLQGSADLNSYKMFAEVFWNLLRARWPARRHPAHRHLLRLRHQGLAGELLFQGRLDFLYAFQNEKKIFAAADHRFKQVAVVRHEGWQHAILPHPLPHGRRRLAGRPRNPRRHPARKRLTPAMVFTPDDVRANSPKTLSLVELKSQRDLAIFRKIYAHSIRIGDNAPGWEITYAREFDMTNDSKHFPPLEKWEAKGYKPDVFGRWIGPEGDVALPFYQGRMIGQFDFSHEGLGEWPGRVAVWRRPAIRQQDDSTHSF